MIARHDHRRFGAFPLGLLRLIATFIVQDKMQLGSETNEAPHLKDKIFISYFELIHF